MPYGYAFSVVVVAAMVAFALWPRPTHGPRATPTFVLGTIGSEAPFLLSLYLIAATWLAYAEGDLGTWFGTGAACVAALTLVGLGRIAWQSAHAKEVLDRALDEGIGVERPRTTKASHRLRSLWAVVTPLRIPDPRVRRTRDITYGPAGSANWLDVYRRNGTRSAPAFLYFHPGGFHSGSKDRQAKLLLETLAMNGWVCASANYRLKTAYGNSLVDAKRAIAWMKAQGPEYGAVGLREQAGATTVGRAW